MPFDSRKKVFEAAQSYNDELSLSFGIHSSLTVPGIPSYRAVFLNTEAINTNGETLTDNTTVGYSGTAGATGTALGVVKDGASVEYQNLVLMPGCNRDINVTVTLLGTMFLEVVPANVITIGVNVQAETTTGRAIAAGGSLTGFTALTASTGVGTATNPEYILVLIK